MKSIKLVSSLCLLQGANSLASFADCDSVLGPVTTDESALEKIKALHESKEWKFSSQCLETVLKRNFMDTATYLLTDYYPNTQIDTEVIVKSVASDIEKKQNYILYKLLRLDALSKDPSA